MREPTTIGSLAPQFERLNSVFTKYTSDALRGITRGYLEALNDLDSEQVAGAVSLALKEEPRFPVPSKLRELAKRWTTVSRPTLLPVPVAEVTTGPQPVCRVCGALPRLAWLETTDWKTQATSQVKRYIAPCDARRHQNSGFVPFPPNFIDWAVE